MKCLVILKVTVLLFTCFSYAQSKLTMEQKLRDLRTKMKEQGYSAVIIPSEDEHQSEYVSEHDERRSWISGFTGSAGTAIVTETEAALWTDSRYYIQADQELDKNFWTLMKASEAETPRIERWLRDRLQRGQIVAQNSKLSSISDWQSLEDNLAKSGIDLKSPANDLIDLVWPNEERPPKPNSEIKIHSIEFAGISWSDKINQVRTKMEESEADLYVVTALDEVAWLFNLRAADIPYNPMLFAYGIVLKNEVKMYIDPSRLNQVLRDYLNGVDIRDYNSILSDIKDFSDRKLKIWISPMSSYAIYNAVGDKKLLISKASPVRSLKARKNTIERRRLINCHIRDSAARVRHMHWMETQMKNGVKITEKDAANKLEEIQGEDPLFAMLSFDSIAAVGANAAIVHYSTIHGTNSPLTDTEIFLLDAGANYQDCTTDITRTHFFGTPSDKIKMAYTKVMQGSIDLANIVFPPGVYGRSLDVEARAHLWRSGLDYGHGTGHGIGYFLSVHEDPPSISYNSRSPYDEPIDIGMVQSDEPGYYEDGSFGIRLETDLLTVETETPFTFRDRKNLRFQVLNFVPFDKNLIDECLLSTEQVDWLNEYNKETRRLVIPLLKNHSEVEEYLLMKTEPFKYAHAYEKCPTYLKQTCDASKIFDFSFFIFLPSLFKIVFNF